MTRTGRRWLSGRGAVAVTAAAGLLLTALLTVAALRLDRSREQSRDGEARAQAIGALRLRTSGLRDRALDVVSLFDASQSVTRDEFRRFTRPIVRSGQASAVSWLVNVAPGRRAAFERARRTRIVRAVPGGGLEPARAGGRSFVVTFTTAEEGSQPVEGMDALTSPDRGEAIRRAVATRRAAVTRPLRLLTNGEAGFVLFVPVLRRPSPGPGLAAADGVVACTFRSDRLQASIRRAVPPGTGVAIDVAGERVVRVGSVAGDAAAAAYDFGGRRWRVRASAAGGQIALAPVAFVGGLLSTLLAAAVARTRRTERLLAQRAVARDRAERRFGDAFASAPIGMAIITPEGEIVRINAAYCELLGQPEEEVLRRNALLHVHPADHPVAREQFRRAIAEPGRPIRCEARAVTPDGERWIESHATFLADEGRLLIQSVDIAERRAFEQTLRHQAEHDPLTELLNRRGLHRVLAEHLAQPGPPQGAVMLLDLDHFKTINDLRGHHVGDEVLQRVARVLLASVRGNDTVARLGGDEFAVLVPGVDAGQARAAAERLVDALRAEARVAELTGSHGVPASIGVAMLDHTTTTPGEALTAADLAMYDAKDAGRGRYALFDGRSEVRSATRDRLVWVERVRSALAERRLQLAAQPIRSLTTGDVSHHELLLRLVEADGSVVRPGEFLTICEQFGLVQEIDAFVAVEAIQLLRRHGASGITLHSNLSGRSLGDPRVLDAIRAELEHAAVDPRRLVFEITETAAVASLDDARAFAEELTAVGCRLALDDFGSGFGSFVYLKELPFDFLKIDGQFVRHSASSPTDRVILESLVHAARGLGKTTVAEFVTDEATERLVRALGVDFAQGYHVGRPVPVDLALGAERGAAP